jgi:PAS domain S-box-containing protein
MHNAVDSDPSVCCQDAAEIIRTQIRLISDQMPLAIGFVDQDGRFLYANRWMGEMINHPPEKCPECANNVFGEEAFSIIGSQLEASLDGQPASFEGELPLGNRSRYVRMHLVPAPVEAGVPDGAIVVLDDLTADKDAFEQLKRSEAALNKAQRVAHIGSWTWNIAAGHLEWSDETYRIFGIDKENFRGNLVDVLDQCLIPEAREAIRKLSPMTVSEDKPASLEFPVTRPDGSVRIVWGEAGEIIFDSEGKPALITGVVQDITERRQAEAAAEEQRRFDNAMRDSLEALTSSLDVETVIDQIFNDTKLVVPHDCARIIQFEGDIARTTYMRGYDSDEQAFLAHFHFTKPFLPYLEETLNNRIYLTGDVQAEPGWPAGYGISTCRSIISVPIAMQDGILGSLSVGCHALNCYTPRDAERLKTFARYAALALKNAFDAARLARQVEERTAELQASKDRVEAILDGGTDAFVLVDEDFNIQQKNAAFNIMFGCETDDYLGYPLAVVLKGPNGIFSRLLDAHNKGRRMTVDIEALQKDGSIFEAELKLGFVADNGCVCTFHDITARKQVERTLQQSIQKEQELNALKSRIVSMASHEFRTPLTVILSTVETLTLYRSRMTDNVIDQKLSTIMGQVSRLRDIMDDVLCLSRLQAGKVEFNPVPSDVDQIFQSIIAEYQSQPHITHPFIYRCERTLPPVAVDEKLLRQLVGNLISNAIKYSPDDKPVEVTLDLVDSSIVFSVRDEGIGIPEADVAHLFDAFHRGSNVGAIPGTGLGLVIMKESIDLHGGTISVKSTLGVGSTFTVHIPA